MGNDDIAMDDLANLQPETVELQHFRDFHSLNERADFVCMGVGSPLPVGSGSPLPMQFDEVDQEVIAIGMNNSKQE